jgi:hypothetical protein
MLDPARARENRSIDSIYAPFLPTSTAPTHLFLCSCIPHWGYTPFYSQSATLCSYSFRYAHSHLASSSTFLFSRLAPQTTRLRLRQLKKPRVAKPSSQLWGWEGGEGTVVRTTYAQGALRVTAEVRESVLPTLRGLGKVAFEARSPELPCSVVRVN